MKCKYQSVEYVGRGFDIMPVSKYNAYRKLKWKEYAHETGHFNSLAGLVFLDNNGNYRKYGYVGVKGKAALWDKTKSSLIRRLLLYMPCEAPKKD